MTIPKYTLRFPFSLASGQTLASTEAGHECECGSLKIKLSDIGEGYHLVIGPFADEESANIGIERAYAGLMWALLHQGISPEAELQPQIVRYASDPVKAAQRLYGESNPRVERLDAVLDGSRPAIYDSDKRVTFFTCGRPSVVQGLNPQQTVSLVSEAMAFPLSGAVVADRKLKVALELYGSFFRESSPNARFLSLIIALEVLAPAEQKCNEVVTLIDEWMSATRERKSRFQPDSEEWASYDSLEREIGFRREVSIRKRIRTLVQGALSRHGDSDADEQAKLAVSLYDMRGRLVHDGYLPGQELGKSTALLRDIVRRVLLVRFIEVAGMPY